MVKLLERTHEFFEGACSEIGRLAGVKLDRAEAADRLTFKEQGELFDLYRAVTKTPDRGRPAPTGPTFGEREAASEFAAALEKLEAPASMVHGQSLTVEYVRESGRVPSAEELRVLRLPPTGASLADLTPELERARPKPAGSPVRTENWSALTEPKQERFRALVAKAAGDPDLFKRRREEHEMRIKVRELAERVRPRPAAKPRLAEAGSISLPAGLMDDVAAEVINARDIAVLVAFLYIWEERKTWASYVSLEGEAIVFESRAGTFWPRGSDEEHSFDLGNGTNLGRNSLKNLEWAEWIGLEQSNQQWRVTPGPRVRALDAARGKVAA